MKDVIRKGLSRLASYRLTWAQTFDNQEILVIGIVSCIFLSIYAAIGGLLAFCAYLVRKNRHSCLSRYSSIIRPLAAFVALSMIVSAFFNNLLGMLIALGMGMVFLAMLYLRSMMTQHLMQAIIKACCLASWFSAAIVVVEKLFHWGAQGYYRAGSTFVNANIYATVIEIIILFCASQLLEAKRKSRWFYNATLVVNLIGLYLCNCRTATAALGVAVLALMILNRRWKALGKTLLVIAAFVAVVYWLPDLSFRINHVSDDLQVRLSIWQTALKAILVNPLFGEGGLSYALIYKQYGGPAAIHAHSLFIDPILNFGLVGTGLLTACFVRVFGGLPRQGARQIERKPYHLIVSILICMLVHGLVDVTIFNVQSGLLFMISLSFAGIYDSQAAHKPVGLASRRNLAA